MEKPILFNTEMVKAILEGRKTCTRRIVKGNVNGLDLIGTGSSKCNETFDMMLFGKLDKEKVWNSDVKERVKAPFMPRDILYVRETWAVCDGLELCSPNKSNIEHQKKEGLVWYRADGEQTNNGKTSGEHLIGRGRWRPSIHMPKAAARIFLEVKEVRIERLQGLDYQGASSEGIVGYDGWTSKFKELWDNTLKKEQLDLYSWNRNPWVWVIDFKRIYR